VSFKGVDSYIESLNPTLFDTWLMLGVAGKAPKFRVELRAQNDIANIPDVLGEVHGPGPINADGPHQLGTTLWHAPEWFVETDLREPSVDAGQYLCNYLYYRGLQAFPNHRIGFLHVPGLEFVPIEVQATELASTIDMIRAPG
jgi:pyrrolidone-carboxylate peptidase